MEHNAFHLAISLSVWAYSAEIVNWFDLYGKALNHDDLLFSTVVALIARMHLNQGTMKISFPPPSIKVFDTLCCKSEKHWKTSHFMSLMK